MISQKMADAINEQIGAEVYSAYLYLSMCSYFYSVDLEGFAIWMRVQALEELTHADKFHRYLMDRGGRVVLRQIDAPPKEWESPLAAFEYQLKHERKVSSLINDLMNLALGEGDHATASLLRWFVDEQVEEEATAQGLVNKVKMVSENNQGLFILDRELGQRVFTPPAEK